MTDNDQNKLNDAGFELAPEALDKGEAGQTESETAASERTPASPEQHENPITGELGRQMLNWYESYALPHAHTQSLGLAVNKDQFIWQLGNDEQVTLSELDQTLSNPQNGLIARYRTLSAASVENSNAAAAISETAVTSEAKSTTELSPTEKQEKENDLARELLDFLTERFLAELAYMAQIERGLKQLVVQTEQNQDPVQLKNLETKLTQVSKDIFMPFLAAADAGQNGLRFGQASFFDRYRVYKDGDQKKQFQTYQTDLREWQRRFDKTLLGNDYILKEQTQTLERTFLDVFQDLQFLVGGNNGEGGIPAALSLIQEKLNAPAENPVDATANESEQENQTVPTDELTENSLTASTSVFTPAAQTVTEKITPVNNQTKSVKNELFATLFRNNLTEETSDAAPIQAGIESEPQTQDAAAKTSAEVTSSSESVDHSS